MNAQEVLTILEQTTKFKPTRSGRGWLTLCPCHEDNSPSLSVAQSGDKLLLKCFVGCHFIDILNAIKGHTTVSVWDSKSPHANYFYDTPFWKREIAATYDYTDETGKLLYQKVRFNPKSFALRFKNGNKWQWGRNGYRDVLYNLPAVISSETVFVLEGEKDVDRLVSWGLVGTTNFDGANIPPKEEPGKESVNVQKWKPDLYNRYLYGKHIILIPDNDVPGESLMKFIYDSLGDNVRSKTILHLPGLSEKQDFSDWADMGNTVEDLRKLYKEFRKVK